MKTRRKIWFRLTEWGNVFDPVEPGTHPNATTHERWCRAEVDRINQAGGRARTMNHPDGRGRIAVQVFAFPPSERI